MKLKIIALCAALVSIVGCTTQADLNDAEEKIQELQASDIRLTTQLAAREATITELQQENTGLKEQLALKPKIPISMSETTALMGPGYVEKFRADAISALVTIKSAALGTTKQVEIHIDSGGSTEISYDNGVTLMAGDTITLENPNYQPIHYTVGK